MAHSVHEDFAATTRDRAQPGFFEITDDPLQRLVEHFAEMNEFTRTESMDVDLGKLAFDMVQQIEIPLFGQLGMMSALH